MVTDFEIEEFRLEHPVLSPTFVSGRSKSTKGGTHGQEERVQA